MALTQTRILGALLNRFWRFNCRARAIDHPLYESNGGFWRWVTEWRGNVLRMGVKRLLGLGQPLPRPVLIRTDSELLIEFDSFHFCFSASRWLPSVSNNPATPRGTLALLEALTRILARAMSRLPDGWRFFDVFLPRKRSVVRLDAAREIDG